MGGRARRAVGRSRSHGADVGPRSRGAPRSPRSPDPAADRSDRAAAVPQPAARGPVRRMQEDNEFRFQDGRGGRTGAAARKPARAVAPPQRPAGAVTRSIPPRIRTRPARRTRSVRSCRRPADHVACRMAPMQRGRADRRTRRTRRRRAARSRDHGAAERRRAGQPPRNPAPAVRCGHAAALADAARRIRSRLWLCAAQGLRARRRRLPQLLEQISRRPARRRRHYWLGESLFQRQRYRDAAEAFLNVSTKYETTAKAPDALSAARAVARRARREGSGLRVARRSPAQISARLGEREAGRRARTEACPLLTMRRRSPPPRRRRCLLRSSTLPPSCSPSPAAPIRPRCWCWRRAGARAEARAETSRRHGRSWPAAANPPPRRAPSKRLARRLGVPHRTVRWRGKKPATGLQEAARARALPAAGGGRASGQGGAIVTAHTLDDQAETVLFRMAAAAA